jgi:addiction module RelE/StbE family toxin
MIVKWLEEAYADLDRIFDYILERNPEAALGVYEAIRYQVDMLVDHPQIGRTGRVRGTRELVITGLPYIAAYYIKEQEVRILAVLHTSRKWPQSFDLE